MNVEKIKRELVRRLNDESEADAQVVIGDILSWIQTTEMSIEDLMEEGKLLNDYGLIRQNIIEGINRFVLHHQRVGHFITAILSNDLREAFARADADNQKTMHQIVSYCHNEIPGVCWGTAKKVEAWTETPVEEWDPGWKHVMAPETTKEIQRQDSLGIWGFTKFQIENRLRDLEKQERDDAE